MPPNTETEVLMGKTVINIENVNIIEGLELCCGEDMPDAFGEDGPESIKVEICRGSKGLYEKLKELMEADGPDEDAGEEEGIADRLAKEYGIDGKTAGAIAAAVDLIRKDLLEE